MSVEKENMLRALADRPLFARKQWQCAFHMHTWLPWDDPIKVRKGAYDYVEQYRACGYCNKIKRRIVAKD